MRPALPWEATITVRPTNPRSSARLLATIGPEAGRDVPGSQVDIRATRSGDVVIAIRARNSGVLRAALNAHLGWLHLAASTELAAAR